MDAWIRAYVGEQSLPFLRSMPGVNNVDTRWMLPTQSRNAGQVGLNMALTVMQKTPTLLMSCEAGSGTRYVCLHYRWVAQALGYPFWTGPQTHKLLHLVCRLGLPKGMEVSRVDNGSLKIGWTGAGPYKDPVKK